MSNRMKVMVGALGLVAIAGTGTGVAVTASDRPASSAAAAPAAGEARERARISLFDQPGSVARGADIDEYRRAGGDLDKFRDWVASTTGKRPESVKLAWTSGQRSLLVTRGEGLVCLRDRTGSRAGSMGCAPESSAADPATPMLGKTKLADGSYVVSGLVADAIDAVVVRLRSGQARVLVPRDNVVAGVVDPEPTGFAWSTVDGERYEYTFVRDPSED